MTNNLVPTPIVDKNGKRTTVHKKPAGSGPASKLSAATPVRPAAEEVSGTPLPVVHPLSPGEVLEFLAFFTPVYDGPGGGYGYVDPVIVSPSITGRAPDVFRSLSGVSQGMLWRVRQAKVLDDLGITVALSRVRWKEQNFWDDLSGSHVPAEELLRSTLRVAERVHADHPDLLAQFDAGQVQHILEDAVGGYFATGALVCKTRELSTVEEVAAVAGTAAYLLVCTTTFDRLKFMGSRSFNDPAGRTHSAMVPTNKTLGKYVSEHPEDAVRAAKFVVERNIGRSKADAQHVIDYLASSAPAISEGYL
jgi:hypothetical protein